MRYFHINDEDPAKPEAVWRVHPDGAVELWHTYYDDSSRWSTSICDVSSFLKDDGSLTDDTIEIECWPPRCDTSA